MKGNQWKHGQSKIRNGGTGCYRSWASMRHRCAHSPYYRGVKIAARWDDFRLFYLDLGPKPHGKTLGRIRDVGNYEPGNVQWMTPRQQADEKIRHYADRPRGAKYQKRAMVEQKAA